MIETFVKLAPHIYGRSDHKSMAYIYMNSVFVINRRGNKSINCCRLYEASMCGAIPVVICSTKEFSETFTHEQSPPWLHAQSYEEAYEVIVELLKNVDALQWLQTLVFEWWQRRIHYVKAQIESCLFFSDHTSLLLPDTSLHGPPSRKEGEKAETNEENNENNLQFCEAVLAVGPSHILV